ncbi:MAG: SAM-dependent methyltransferase [Gammaproteobacteria bacterium]
MNGGATAARPQRFLTLSVAVVSGATLGYEILLMRLFSIIQWHHFAYMIISLALLGYGVSGVFLAVVRDRLAERFEQAFPLCILLFAISAPGCFWLGQRLPFNPAEIFWAPSQILYLFILYTLLALPFFFAATAVGMALYRFRGLVAGIYAADLMGAGCGSVLVVMLLFQAFPEQVLILLALIGIAGVLPICITAKRNRLCLTACVAVAALLLLAPQRWTQLQVSPYKGLQQLLRIPGTRIIDRFSGPLGYIDIVASSKTPLRHAPGLSLNASAEFPEQEAVFSDADNMSALTHYDGRSATLEYLDQTTSALPYHLRKPEHLLILGAGTGSDLLQARYFGIDTVDAVELNGQLLQRLQSRYAAYSGDIFTADNVHMHVGEARGYVASSGKRFDMIQIALLDAYGASSAGLYALSENYLYTVEALREYIAHLKPGGYLAITRWIKMPPRDALKLFATAVDAVKSSANPHPEQQLILIRGWQTSTLLVKNGTVTPAEIITLKTFCDQRSFDVAYYPGISATETNRFNILTDSYYYRAALALLSPERENFIENYKFDIRPATDNQPYFFQFFKWTTLPEIVSLYGRGGISLLESGYILLVAALLQALTASILFIGLPLKLWQPKLGFSAPPMQAVRSMGYFFCLGLAFLFVEIAFMQKFILFLHHPVYAVTVVLSAFLISAGAGSYTSRTFIQRHGRYAPIAAIAVLGLLYLLVLKDLTGILLHQPSAVNFAVSILLAAVLGFFMGMPFPTGLSLVAKLDPALIPWAWGVNGFASVISAILATLIAIHWGFNVLILAAVTLYLAAAASLPKIAE